MNTLSNRLLSLRAIAWQSQLLGLLRSLHSLAMTSIRAYLSLSLYRSVSHFLFRSLTLSLLLSLYPSLPLSASGSGTTSLQFLKLGVGARQMAMGEATLGLADDLNASYWNPAALGGLYKREVSFLHTQWFQDVRYQYAGLAWPTETWGTVGAQVHYLTVDNIIGYSDTGLRGSDVQASDKAIGLMWGHRWKKDLMAGVGLKWIQEDLAGAKGTALGLDLGGWWKPFSQGWASPLSFGGSIRNLGSGPQFDQVREDLPQTFGLGIGYEGFGEMLKGGLDIIKPVDRGVYMSLGSEVWLMNLLAVRVGYRSQHDLGSGLSFGVGMQMLNMQVDYAFVDYDELGNTHRISLTYRFSGTDEIHYRKGLTLMRNGRYAQAILEFDKAFEINPKHPTALLRMKECHERIKQIREE